MWFILKYLFDLCNSGWMGEKERRPIEDPGRKDMRNLRQASEM